MDEQKGYTRRVTRKWLLFWIEVNGPDDCWPWKGIRDKDGYGITKVLLQRQGYERKVGHLNVLKRSLVLGEQQ